MKRLAPCGSSLGENAELHVYAETDEDHRFFGDGPVPGLLVDDYTAASNG